MTVAFSNYSMLSMDSYSGAETIVVAASSTHTTSIIELSMWDSKDGVFFTVQGTRYGTLDADVAIQIKQATRKDAPASAWEDVGSATSFGTGGTVGTPSATYVTIKAFPSANTTFMNYFKLVITTQAGAGCTITRLLRSSRGR